MSFFSRLDKRLTRLERTSLKNVFYKGYTFRKRYKSKVNRKHATMYNFTWQYDLMKRNGFISKKTPFKQAWKTFKNS